MQTKDLEIFFKQYEIGVEMADKISQRRGENNKFYSTILLALSSTIIAIFKNNIYHYIDFICILSLLGIAFSIIWLLNIKSYRTLNKAKFRVLFEMEKKLPYKLYSDEYQYLNEYEHFSLTKIEKNVPIIFIIAFILIILFSILRILFF